MYNDKELTYKYANEAIDSIVLLAKSEDLRKNKLAQKQCDIHLFKLRKLITELYCMIPKTNAES